MGFVLLMDCLMECCAKRFISFMNHVLETRRFQIFEFSSFHRPCQPIFFIELFPIIAMSVDYHEGHVQIRNTE
jgi:hypothetical protein